jgi:ADP-ribosylglycohydrolase
LICPETLSTDFESGLNAALEFAGPENYCPVLVGAMLGARFGNDNIPKAYYSSATEELQARVYQVITSLALSWPQ